MTRLNWGATGERFYETGVDHGVLYVDSVGYAWPGLISVSEAASGGTPRAYYIDAYKYANVASVEEFDATIQAFSSPSEFAVCDGAGLIHTGLVATQQPRRPFDFSYRTLVGNDIEGSDYGYKIHLVYNALAAPAARANSSLGQTTTPGTLSWSISTRPPMVAGIRPTSHFVIDSNQTPDAVLTELEDIIYGSDGSNSSIPTVAELIELFNV